MKVDSDGFIETGDMATFHDNKIQIFGKEKYLIKLKNEKYISPEDVEAKIVSVCRFEDVFITKATNSSDLIVILAVKDKKVDEDKILSLFMKKFQRLISKNELPEYLEIDHVKIVTGFNKREHSYMYTQKESKKRDVILKRGAFSEILKKVTPRKNIN